MNAKHYITMVALKQFYVVNINSASCNFSKLQSLCKHSRSVLCFLLMCVSELGRERRWKKVVTFESNYCRLAWAARASMTCV